VNGAVDPPDDRIDILLATYNGERFLAEQLESIAAQSHANWHLLARDDGSSDGTVQILKAFQARHPDRVTIIDDTDGNLGLVQNFSRLMAHSNAPYVAFCDQDDVWKREKLETGLAQLRELERMHGTDVPLLVFSDLVLVDASLNVIHPSFWRYQGLKPECATDLNQLLVLNVVTGCASLLNRALVEKALPIPPRAQAHDWWVALVAAALGRSAHVAQAGLLYRQHGENRFGARRAHVFNLAKRSMILLHNYARRRQFIAASFEQARIFRQRYADELSDLKRRELTKFEQIPNQNLPRRIVSSCRCGCWPNGVLRKIVFVAASRRL